MARAHGELLKGKWNKGFDPAPPQALYCQVVVVSTIMPADARNLEPLHSVAENACFAPPVFSGHVMKVESPQTQKHETL